MRTLITQAIIFVISIAILYSDDHNINESVKKEELNEKVDKLANELTSLAPETMKFGLEAYEKQDSKSFDDALPYLKEQIAKCFESKDAKEGIAAFLEKRKPNWD